MSEENTNTTEEQSVKRVFVADHNRTPSLGYLSLADHLGALCVNGLIQSLTSQPGDTVDDGVPVPEGQEANHIFLPKNPNPVHYFCAIYGWLGGMVNASFRLAELREAGQGTSEDAARLDKMISTAAGHVTAYMNGFLAGQGITFGGGIPDPQAPFMEFFRPGTVLPSDSHAVISLFTTLAELVNEGSVHAEITQTFTPSGQNDPLHEDSTEDVPPPVL